MLALWLTMCSTVVPMARGGRGDIPGNSPVVFGVSYDIYCTYVAESGRIVESGGDCSFEKNDFFHFRLQSDSRACASPVARTRGLRYSSIRPVHPNTSPRGHFRGVTCCRPSCCNSFFLLQYDSCSQSSAFHFHDTCSTDIDPDTSD